MQPDSARDVGVLYPRPRRRLAAVRIGLVALIGLTGPMAIRSTAAATGHAPAEAATTAPQGGAMPSGGAPVGVGAVYVPVVPCRLVDTRRGFGFVVLSFDTVRVRVTGRCSVPGGATAAALTVTVADTRGSGYLTVYPAATGLPTASNLNFTAGSIRSNGAIVGLAAGSVDVRVYGGVANAAVVVDVAGAFVPAPSARAGRYLPLPPGRLLDTRTGRRPAAGSVTRVPLPVGVPADASAVMVNVTATESAGPGWVAAVPAGAAMGETSNVNLDGRDQTRAAAAVVPVTGDGFDLHVYAATHLVVDVMGYFTGASAADSTDGLFTSSAPVRLLDTRTDPPAIAPGGVRRLPGVVLSASGVPADAAAVAVNVTIAVGVDGFVAAYPAGTSSNSVSSVNGNPDGSPAANLAVVGRSAAGIDLWSYDTADVLIDVAGWFTGPPADPLATPASIDRGSSCAAGYRAADLDAWFSQPHDEWFGADTQRAYKLPDGRVLWMFQDGIITTTTGEGRLVHDIGMIQSGRCFDTLYTGTRDNPQPWLFADQTIDEQHWYWPMGGAADPDGRTFHLLMAEMHDDGPSYLSHTSPVAMWLVDLAVADLTVIAIRPAPDPSTDLYGWSVTSDNAWTYLYSNCYLQFGHGWLGHDPCTGYSNVARVPHGRLDLAPTYWDGTRWTTDRAAAVAVITPATTGDPYNAAQVMWDGTHYLIANKTGDWWGHHILIQTSTTPTGPWTTIADIPETLQCGDPDICNTYFASWTPWRNNDNTLIYAISNNRWDATPSPIYHPRFFTTPAPP